MKDRTVWSLNSPGGSDLDLDRLEPELWTFVLWNGQGDNEILATRKDLLELHEKLGEEFGV